MLIAQSLIGCSLSRPDQDNFLVDASGIGGTTLSRELSSKLQTRVSTTQLTLPDSEKAEMYWLDGNGFTLTIMPLPDDRCNPNANDYITYNEQQFGVDLVYTTSSRAIREKTKRQFLRVLRDARIPVKEFKDC